MSEITKNQVEGTENIQQDYTLTTQIEVVNEENQQPVVETVADTANQVSEKSEKTAQPIEESLADRILRQAAERKKDAGSQKISVKNVQKQSDAVLEEKAQELADTTSHEHDFAEIHEVISEIEDVDEIDDSDEEQEPLEDFTLLSKNELLAKLRELIETKSIQRIKSNVENIKVNFYKKHNSEIDELRAKFLEANENADAEDFKLSKELQNHENEMKELLQNYRDKKHSYNQEIEKSKDSNLKKRYEIIEKIKSLINGEESIDRTFHDFRGLQSEWRDAGQVPQNEVKNVWETYNFTVEKFYDYIKINKELRDLDLRKNLETKIELCEKAEELHLENNVIKAFKSLQKLHNSWREIGPVPTDKKDEIWERFKEATTKINKRHQEYFEKLKEEQKKNLKAKTILCEKAEEILGGENYAHNEWEEKSNELIELQKIWKLLGFAPKKDNNKIYARFRKACDDFFEKKRDFYNKAKEQQAINLQLKTELSIQAEGLKESTDWKKTTDEYIEIQKKWKEIGPVPRKQSDIIWKRFREACNYFFERKQKHFESIDSVQEENLQQKLELIKKAENFEYTDNIDDDFEKIKEYQKQWTDIGHVPFKNKNDVQLRFREAVNKVFDTLKSDEGRRSEIRYKTKIESFQQAPKKFKQEREKLIQKLERIQNDITVWENNIGYFAKSKNAEPLIFDFSQKIDEAKKIAKSLEEKIEMLDGIEQK